MTDILKLDGWALILGASSGFGEAAARAFAKEGMNIAGVHLDRKAGLKHVAELQAELESMGVKTKFFNVNAADETKRGNVVSELEELAGNGSIRVLLHSLAFGTLLPYWRDDEGATIKKRNMDMTLDVMAHSLVYWTQDVLRAGLFTDNARIYAMTSAGSTNVWPGYGAVSAAKCALEAHIRQLAIELAPHNIVANAICAGVTDTPALRKIPGNETMIEQAISRNPFDRLTTPEDVADSLVALSTPAAKWINGNVIYVDGGEVVAG